MKTLQEHLLENFSHPSQEKAQEICSGEEILGIGKTRIVVNDGEGVIKLAWQEAGLVDNEVEYMLYQRASKELQTLLCPTEELYSDGSTRQKRCQPIAFKELGQEGLRFVSHLSTFGLSDAAVNIGQLEGRLVCYDYSLLSPDLLGQLLWENFYQ